jgi:hypothetical protein
MLGVVVAAALAPFILGAAAGATLGGPVAGYWTAANFGIHGFNAASRFFAKLESKISRLFSSESAEIRNDHSDQFENSQLPEQKSANNDFDYPVQPNYHGQQSYYHFAELHDWHKPHNDPNPNFTGEQPYQQTSDYQKQPQAPYQDMDSPQAVPYSQNMATQGIFGDVNSKQYPGPSAPDATDLHYPDPANNNFYDYSDYSQEGHIPYNNPFNSFYQ